MAKKKPLLDCALEIPELAYTLDNISTDDKRKLGSYSDEEILKEARYVLGLFADGGKGHINGELPR